MLMNYLKVALRNIWKHKTFSVINISGLAVGMACAILIFLWVQDELNYDKFHLNADQLYHVAEEDHRTAKVTRDGVTPIPLGPAIEEEFPEIAYATRYTRRSSTPVLYKEKVFNELLGFVDPSIFKMFTFTFIKGNPETAFLDPYSAVITEKMAEKYFGHENPLNKTLRINNQLDLKITAVIRSFPHNSQLKFNLLTPFGNFKEFVPAGRMKNWNFSSIVTFVLLRKNADINEVNKKISGFLGKKSPRKKIKLFLRPLSDMHLFSLNGGGRIKYVYIFSLVALFVLIIACINFVNLSTACSGARAKELGLRKIVGAHRTQIIKQFLGESILVSIISLVFSALLIELFLPAFRTLSGKPLTLSFLNGEIILALIATIVITGVIAGIYPAAFLSSIEPLTVIKRNLKTGPSWARKLMVVTQFTLSIILIICTIVISSQLNYINNRDLGFDRKNLVYIGLNGDIIKKYESIRGEFLQNSNIQGVTMCSDPLGVYAKGSTTSLDWEGKGNNDNIVINLISVNYDFIKTFNLEMVQGRDFSREFSVDPSNYILNEEAVKRMGIKSPIGKKISMSDMEGTINGVVKDFNFESLYSEVKPLLFFFFPQWYSHISVRIKPANISNTISFLEKTIKKFVPTVPFEYHFQDEYFERLYGAEQKMKKLIYYFAVLAIFVSCLGLFGLTSFLAEKKKKEIGIRKVLGASISKIIVYLYKEFTNGVIIANIIAWPIAYYAMNKWLQDFAYRVSISPWIFIFSAMLALGIGLFTVSYQVAKAGIANPVEALKNE